MKKGFTFRYIFGFLVIAVLTWVVYRLSCKVNADKIITTTKELYEESVTSFPENYDSLIAVDLINGRTYLKETASYAIMVNNQFPYRREHIDIQTTEEIIKILNDSSTYRWGELGTPYHEKTIEFYDNKGNAIGFTDIDYGGELDSYPYRSLMKWGSLSEKGYKRFVNALGEKYSQ